MGSAFSVLNNSVFNSYVTKFLADEEIVLSDPFWNQLLSFTYSPVYSKEENDFILDNIYLILKSHEDNLKFRNFFNLISVLLIRSDELKRSSECQSVLSKDSIFLKQIYNGLFIIRYAIKFLIEKNQVDILGNDLEKDHESLFKKLLSTLLTISIEIHINNATYFVHLEIIVILNIIMNCDLYTLKSYALQDILFEDECTIHSRAFIKNLLENITNLHETKSVMKFDQRQPQGNVTNYSGSNLWSFVSFGYFANPIKQTNDSTGDCLCSECVFLIIKLFFHSKTKDCYKKPLCSFFDPKLTDAQLMSNKNYSSDSTLEISFSMLLKVFISNFDEEHYVLLFYLFLHKNLNFRAYILSQENFKDMILPFIKLIYNYSSENSNSVYMALIILLIMTEGNFFNSSVHREIIDHLPWIKEKTITNMTVGSLIVWILCRTIQFNIGYIGDRYIHINCLATLANMSAKFVNLHPVASEQIMILLNILQKRKIFISNSLKSIDSEKDNEKYTNLTNNLSIIEEILQIHVEIINAALIFSLNNNPHMIHTFLYHRKVFPLLKDNPSTQNIVCNIDAILTYFSTKIEKELGKAVTSQTEVLNIIKKFSPSINKLNNFKRFPELKFKYIEQESSEEFFIPYVWKFLCKKSVICFRQKDDDYNNNCKC